jgi:hypothetical protein
VRGMTVTPFTKHRLRNCGAASVVLRRPGVKIALGVTDGRRHAVLDYPEPANRPTMAGS